MVFLLVSTKLGFEFEKTRIFIYRSKVPKVAQIAAISRDEMFCSASTDTIVTKMAIFHLPTLEKEARMFRLKAVSTAKKLSRD